MHFICRCVCTAYIFYLYTTYKMTNLLYTYTGSIYDSINAPGGIEGYKHYISWIKRELIAGTYIYKICMVYVYLHSSI